MTTSIPCADPSAFLPDDGFRGTLVARVWTPGSPAGPSVAALRADGVFELSAAFATMSDLLAQADPAAAVQECAGRRVCSLDELLAASCGGEPDPARSVLLAPCDLQVIKAAGVTFASSLLERVIEERAGGDASRALDIRTRVEASIGTSLASLRPGSAQAAALKTLLQQQGLWSQYLEVGIGPDAEIFTKAPVLSAVGSGQAVGVRSDSTWNNPEPEVVLAVDGRGRIVGATLGNDVNLRDFEGRSALLLGKSKDNNASCAIGPFIRLFDASYGLADVRGEVLQLRVAGRDGFELRGTSTMASITRDPTELVAQALAAHQYPDGFMLFLGTLFAPTQDRREPGSGFTHDVGDLVTIRSPGLGELRNGVAHCEDAPPWRFGVGALMRNLAARGLLR